MAPNEVLALIKHYLRANIFQLVYLSPRWPLLNGFECGTSARLFRMLSIIHPYLLCNGFVPLSRLHMVRETVSPTIITALITDSFQDISWCIMNSSALLFNCSWIIWSCKDVSTRCRIQLLHVNQLTMYVSCHPQCMEKVDISEFGN